MTGQLRTPFALTFSLALALGAAPAVRGGEVRDFYNVLAADGADPWVWKHTDGRYYLTATTGRDITVLRSDTLSGLGGGERKVVWTPPRSGPVSRDLWAPELHQIDGKWYVYFAADDGKNANHRLYVLENDAADPFQGEFRLKGKLAPPGDDHWAIDGTVFRAGGRLYCLWSGWEGTEDVRQDLYVAPMSNPWTIVGPRVAIVKPTEPWESHGAPPAVSEGPQVLVKGRSIHVVYSASGSWTDRYCLGLLTADAGRDLLAPDSWVKQPGPVFASANGVFGPGHCSFTTSPDGSEDWIVYHAARYRGAGWARNVRAQRFGWDGDTPRFGAPAPPDVPLPLPGGEPPRLRLEAEDASTVGPARTVRHAGASRGIAVEVADEPGGAVAFVVRSDAAAQRHLAVRFNNPSADNRSATHAFTVNGGAPKTLRYEFTGRDNWSVVTVSVALRPGPNRLRFEARSGVALIDAVDVFPAAGLRDSL